MRGKTVVITGATSGIGAETAVKLASMGARVVMVARDRLRAEPVLKRIAKANPSAQHVVHYADLSRLSEMKRVASDIALAESRIDVLVNNAGAIFGKRQETADGLEMTFALNHMAYFVITQGLLERLKATPGARIVSTSSDAHTHAKLDFDDLQGKRKFSAFGAYGKSKLCNILFTRALSRRLAGSGVTANCLHPGFVATRFADNNGGTLLRAVLTLVKGIFAISPKRGAQTIIHLTSSQDVVGKSGGYYFKCRLATPVEAALNDDDAERLWIISEKIAQG